MRNIVISEITLEELCSALADKVIERISERQRAQSLKDTVYITRKEAAKLLKISLPTLSNYCKEGRIPSYRIGCNIRFKRSDIEQIVDSGLRYNLKKNQYK